MKLKWNKNKNSKNKKMQDFYERYPALFIIEATRFELATSASRTQRSTKLSHASI